MAAPTLETLEAKIDALAALVASSINRSSAKSPVATARMTACQAMARLQCSRSTLRRYVSRGLLREIQPTGQGGPGKRVFYHPDEVQALALSEAAAAELQARKRFGRNH